MGDFNTVTALVLVRLSLKAFLLVGEVGVGVVVEKLPL